METKNGKQFQAFKNIPFQNCNSCHKDVHKGSFGANCSSCHETSSFKQINKSAFDHSKTKFPLIGKHKSVGCNNCHKSPTGYKMKFSLCTDCHTDFHKAQFVVNDQTQNCVDCHSENGFQTFIFSIEKHNKTKFQITGAHLATPCESCHYQQNNWQFKGIGIACISCHENIHKNELKIEFIPDNNCSFCHQTESWNTINFDHNKTNFPLLGKHNSIFHADLVIVKMKMKKHQLFFPPLKKNVKAVIKMFTSGNSRLMEFQTAVDVMLLKIGNRKNLITAKQSLI